ncbi:MAG TPA: SRPBCC family protein [Verrucomicrobiae bacterium]|nr:SRPBCC family protein [Verrucomicrobiae bacterium]
MKLPTYPTTVKRTHRDVAVTLEARVEAEPSQVFDFVVSEGMLPEDLTRYTPFLPAVVRISGNTGPWDMPGSSKTVHLKDGSTALEEVGAYDRPDFLAHKSSQITLALRYLADGSTVKWWFAADGAATDIRWTYVFKTKGWLSSVALMVFVRLVWSGYIAVCPNNTQRHFANDCNA